VNVLPILHPLLLGIYPALSLLAANSGEVFLDDVWRSLIGLMLVAGGWLGICRRLLPNAHAAALLASATLVIGFSHRAITAGLAGVGPLWIEEFAPGIAIGFGIVGWVGVFAMARRIQEGAGFTIVLNTVTIVLVALPAVQLARDSFELTRGQPSSLQERLGTITLQRPETEPPDIYYIVLDGYARADALKEFFAYDNSEFIGFLKSKGFFVAEQSAANYLSTRLVIPAVLNLDYLDALANRVGRHSRDVRPLERAGQRNRVVDALTSIGYRIVNITSGLDYLVQPSADEHLDLEASWWNPNEFETVLMRMTALPDLYSGLERLGFGTPPTVAFHRDRIEYAIEALGQQSKRQGPKFVYAHILSPHNPFVFGPNGEPRAVDLELFRGYTARQNRILLSAYRDQLHYLNRRIMGVIERILEQSAQPPIVVLQGDHGLRLFLERAAEDTCLQESFSILNAYHLPGAGAAAHDTLSPVNSFRLIFDAHFGTELGLLEDRAYFSHRYGIYDFVEVTDRVETCSTRAAIPRLRPAPSVRPAAAGGAVSSPRPGAYGRSSP
jgi:hypothetical protein